jgi:hypothetical protein
MGLFSNVNPLERRVIRYLALHCLTPNPIGYLADVGFHFPLLDRLWHVFVAAVHQSEFPFKHYLRAKPSQILKSQLEDMVQLSKLNMHFNPASQGRSMATALVQAAHLLDQGPQIGDSTPMRRSSTTTTKPLVEEQAEPACHSATGPDVHFPAPSENLASIMEINEEPAGISETAGDQLQDVRRTHDEVLMDLVSAEFASHTRIRLKVMITPEFNRIFNLEGNQRKSHQSLKRRF